MKIRYVKPILHSMIDAMFCDCAPGSGAINTETCEGGSGQGASSCSPTGISANTGAGNRACNSGTNAVAESIACDATGSSAIGRLNACQSGSTPDNTGNHCYTGSSAAV